MRAKVHASLGKTTTVVGLEYAHTFYISTVSNFINNEKWSSGLHKDRPTQQTNVFLTSIHYESGKNCNHNKQSIQSNHSSAVKAF
jgi:hypothetical protein